jgi:short-subunit dehydrogenase
MTDANRALGPAPGSRGTVVIVGAGPGVGASVAARAAADGYSVGLVARNGDRLARMATDLEERTGAPVAVATADATVPEAVQAALTSVTDELGEASVLCFSPIPDVGLIKPVTETRPQEFMASLQLNIAGAAAAVETVLPAMVARGAGSLLFTTGSAALRPDPARAASVVTTTATTAYISLLRQALDGSGVRVGHTVVVGPIDRDRDDAHDPDDIAADLWRHHEGMAVEFPSVLRLT